MKNMRALILATAFSLMSFGAFAQSVTATGATLDSTEAIIAAKAKAAGAVGYKITSARMGNYVTMSAKLNK
jgi:hypothetical protein